MATQHATGLSRKKALIVIPNTVNYFNNVAGRRLGEALTNLGMAVDIHSLQACPDQEYDWCFLISIKELVVSCKNHDYAMQRIARLKSRCQMTAMWLLEPVESRWFADSFQVFQEAGIELLIDTALHDQREFLPPEAKPYYQFVFYGLTASEVRSVRTAESTDTRRVIPWVQVGHMTNRRVRLAERLVNEFDPGGFVYLPTLAPVTENGPHLNDGQFQRILERTRLHIWCAHNDAFYLEGERFRRSLLSGSLPLKVLFPRRTPAPTVPFSYLLLEQESAIERIRAFDFQSTRQRFIDEYLALPTLEQALARFFASEPVPHRADRHCGTDNLAA